MGDYQAPKKPPRVGQRVHRTGPVPVAGEVRAVLRGRDRGVFVVRWWVKHKRCFDYECCTSLAWQYGGVRPGPVPPRREDGRWPWEARGWR